MILKLAFLSQVVEKSRKYGNGWGKYYSKDFSSSKGYKPHPWLPSVVNWVKIRRRSRSLSCWLGVAFLSSIGISWPLFILNMFINNFWWGTATDVDFRHRRRKNILFWIEANTINCIWSSFQGIFQGFFLLEGQNP